MVSDLIKEYFARPLEDKNSGTVVRIFVSSSEGDNLVWSTSVKEKSGTWDGSDLLIATRKKVRRLYNGVVRSLLDRGVSRSQLRRETHSVLILKLIRRVYEQSYSQGDSVNFSQRIDWDPSRAPGDRLSLISESCSPIGGSDVAN